MFDNICQDSNIRIRKEIRKPAEIVSAKKYRLLDLSGNQFMVETFLLYNLV